MRMLQTENKRKRHKTKTKHKYYELYIVQNCAFFSMDNSNTHTQAYAYANMARKKNVKEGTIMQKLQKKSALANYARKPCLHNEII
jgi:hypothetical protein